MVKRCTLNVTRFSHEFRTVTAQKGKFPILHANQRSKGIAKRNLINILALNSIRVHLVKRLRQKLRNLRNCNKFDPKRRESIKARYLRKFLPLQA